MGRDGDAVNRTDHFALLATDTVLNPIEQLSPIALGNLAYISLFLERMFIGILVRNCVLEHLLKRYAHADEHRIERSIDIKEILIHREPCLPMLCRTRLRFGAFGQTLPRHGVGDDNPRKG